MKFLSFARLFGSKRSQARVKRSSGSERTRRWEKSIRRGLFLEALEDRMLPSTTPILPAAQVPTSSHVPVDIGTPLGKDWNDNLSTPSVSIDPVHPNRVIAAYVRNDTTNLVTSGFAVNHPYAVRVEGAYSIDGGTTWTIFQMPDNLIDGIKTNINGNNQVDVWPMQVADSPSVGFDGLDNFYIVYSEHSNDAGQAEGDLVLQKYEFTADAAPTLDPSINNKILYS
jgi:hypothetical protein